MENIKRIGRTLVHKGSVIDLYDDEMILPDGTVKHYDFIKHNGASCVIPVLPYGYAGPYRLFEEYGKPCRRSLC